MTNFVQAVEENGFAIIDPYLDLGLVDLLIRSIADLHLNPGRAGIRNLLELSPCIQNRCTEIPKCCKSPSDIQCR